MGDSLAERGWSVAGLGLHGGLSAPPDWPVHTLSPDGRSGESPAVRRAGMNDIFWFIIVRTWSFVAIPLVTGLKMMRFPGARTLVELRRRAWEDPHSAAEAVRRWPSFLRRGAGRATEAELLAAFPRLWPQAQQLIELAETEPGPALWIANDWNALPAALAGCRRSGGAVVYDSHEYAAEEYGERPFWRRYRRPVVVAVEQRFIGEARIVTAVSPGIADRLTAQYGLEPPAGVLRNTPLYREAAFQPVGRQVKLLYHGVVGPGRGLMECVEALASLPDRFRLTIRGPARDEGFLAELRASIVRVGVSGRVNVRRPIPTADLVEAASAFDIGLMVLPGHSVHNALALPNKLFEYMMAGLALGVTDLPEMANLVEETGAGFTFPQASSAGVRDVLSRLSDEQINRFKQASLSAARRYCWEEQSAPVLSAYEALADGLSVA